MKNFLYWVNKISWKSIFFALGGAILIGLDTDSFLVDTVFVLSGWNMILWAIAREIKIADSIVAEIK